MKHLFRRLSALERRATPTGPCRCRPPDVVWGAEGDAEPPPERCAACGRTREVIQVVYVNTIPGTQQAEPYRGPLAKA